MIKCGHLVGYIIDALSDIENQIKMRNKIGLTDLSKVSENFIKDILNIIYCWDLENANKTRSNAPGADLIGSDEARNKIIIQVTSTANASKVSETLTQIDADSSRFGVQDDGRKIFIWVLGKKQGSYSLQEVREDFTVNSILDFSDLCKILMDTSSDKLNDAYKYLIEQCRISLIELELKDSETDRYPTDFSNHFEVNNAVFLQEYNKINSYCISNNYEDLTSDYIAESVNSYISTLENLPRFTRQIYAKLLLEPSYPKQHNYSDGVYKNLQNFIYKSNYNITDHLNNIIGFKLIYKDDEEIDEYRTKILLAKFQTSFHEDRNDEILHIIMDTSHEYQLDIANAIVNLDFSQF